MCSLFSLSFSPFLYSFSFIYYFSHAEVRQWRLKSCVAKTTYAPTNSTNSSSTFLPLSLLSLSSPLPSSSSPFLFLFLSSYLLFTQGNRVNGKTPITLHSQPTRRILRAWQTMCSHRIHGQGFRVTYHSKEEKKIKKERGKREGGRERERRI